MKRKLKICKECQEPTVLWSGGMCKSCAGYAKVQEGYKKAAKQRSVKKNMSIPLLKKMVLKSKRKPTGELALFKEIWNERPHICEVSGELIRRFDIRCFSHILTKGAYPSFRLYKENIVLVTPEMHHEWEFQKRDHPRWEWVKIRSERLKLEYHAL